MGTTRTKRGVNGALQRTMGPVSFATAGGAATLDDDPMSRVFVLGAKTSGLRAWFGYTSGSTAMLALLMAFASLLAWVRARHAHDDAAVPEEIDVLKEESPAPPPPTEEPKSETPPAAPPPRALPRDVPPPPPAPAQAAKVLTQEPDPNEPVDLTGNTIVQGNADAYAGGFTASNGKSANAVRSLPGPVGVVGGSGPASGGPDRSRPASIGGGAEWTCPFPPEADTSQTDEAYVTLQVDVRPDGSPASVRIVRDPGSGFGREARRCALAKHYVTALDHEGNPIAATTKPFGVHFSR